MGPVTFVVGWAVLGQRREGYSPVDQAISILAEAGSSTRAPMTLAFATFAFGVVAFATALASRRPGPAAIAGFVTAVATLGVAAFPVGDGLADQLHGLSAVVGYAGLAALPTLDALRPGTGHRWRVYSLATAVLAGGFLIATAVAPHPGVWQRLGLGVGDLWIVVAAAGIVSGPSAAPSTTRSNPPGEPSD